MNLDPLLTPCTKINTKWIIYLNIRAETVRLLGKKKKKGVNLHKLGLSSGFLDMTPEVQATEE